MKWLEIFPDPGMNKRAAIRAGLYNVWDAKRIKGAFNFGNGTFKDFERYMADNGGTARFVCVDKEGE